MTSSYDFDTMPCVGSEDEGEFISIVSLNLGNFIAIDSNDNGNMVKVSRCQYEYVIYKLYRLCNQTE